jgi:hypothetical protein
MSNDFPFALDSDEDIILVRAWIEGYGLNMALDTAATHTVIDVNVLLMKGHDIPKDQSMVTVETASGLLEAQIISSINFEALGIEREDFPVLSYDFLMHGILSPYDGVIGLDFFKNTVLTIDFQKMIIKLHD